MTLALRWKICIDQNFSVLRDLLFNPRRIQHEIFCSLFLKTGDYSSSQPFENVFPLTANISLKLSCWSILFLGPAMLNFSRFQVISFDCYGTLIDWESGLLSALQPILSDHQAELSDSEILQLYGELDAKAASSEYGPYREVLGTVLLGVG